MTAAYASTTATAPRKEVLRVKDIQDILGISQTKAYDLVYSGELPSIRVGRSIRVLRDDLDQWMWSQRRQSA